MATSPVSVNLIALPTRLIRTCVKRRPSPRPGGSSRGNFHLEREFFIGCKRLKRTADGLGNVLNRVIGEFEDELAGLDLGEIENIVNQAQQMTAVAFKPFEHSAHFFGWLAIGAVRHQFGISQNGIERRAQLVAHIGEELRLVLARLFELPALVLDFVEQPHILDGDGSLIGEGCDKFNLPIGERPN